MHLSTEGVSLKVAFEPDMGQLVRIQGATKKKLKRKLSEEEPNVVSAMGVEGDNDKGNLIWICF